MKSEQIITHFIPKKSQFRPFINTALTFLAPDTNDFAIPALTYKLHSHAAQSKPDHVHWE